MCLQLAPLALGIVFFYSFTKRFTSFSHLVLGFSLGIAPAAAWIAVRGSLDPRILWLTAAVTCWTAGFDIIYACQDYEFDSAEALHSIPRALGHRPRIARGAGCCMLLMIGSPAGAGLCAAPGSFWRWRAWRRWSALLIYEHSLVKPNDFSRVNAAFFTMNGYVSVLFFVFWAADIFL